MCCVVLCGVRVSWRGVCAAGRKGGEGTGTCLLKALKRPDHDLGGVWRCCRPQLWPMQRVRRLRVHVENNGLLHVVIGHLRHIAAVVGGRLDGHGHKLARLRDGQQGGCVHAASGTTACPLASPAAAARLRSNQAAPAADDGPRGRRRRSQRHAAGRGIQPVAWRRRRQACLRQPPKSPPPKPISQPHGQARDQGML